MHEDTNTRSKTGKDVKTFDGRTQEEMGALRTFAEEALKFYKLVANHTDSSICAYDTIPYKKAQMILIHGIGMAYPDLSDSDISEVYEILVDSGEDVSYAVMHYNLHGSI